MGLKILHSADWHMGSSFASFPEAERDFLRRQQKKLPAMITEVCRRERCDLVLLAGDIFDGPVSRDCLETVQQALEDCGVPVFVSPGNHDPLTPGSPWLEAAWPENVTVFPRGITGIALPELDCRIWGAGYDSMDCPALLEGFRAEGPETYQIGLFHGDPVTAQSPYCPVTARQIRESGLTYLALGHVHKTGSLTCGDTLCAWPGCPMGRGLDETGEKGICIVSLEEAAKAAFVPLDTVRFQELEGTEEELEQLLGAAEIPDFIRLTVTGWGDRPLPELGQKFPNLTVLDRRLSEDTLWAEAGEDTLMGAYFQLLRQQAETDPRAVLAARLSRSILEDREVTL